MDDVNIDRWADLREAWAAVRRMETLDRQARASAGRYYGVGACDPETGEYEDYREDTAAAEALYELCETALASPRTMELVRARPDLAAARVMADHIRYLQPTY